MLVDAKLNFPSLNQKSEKPQFQVEDSPNHIPVDVALFATDFFPQGKS